MERSGHSYRGTINTTVSGIPCQNWYEDYPQEHSKEPPDHLGDSSNYCRGPDKMALSAWCYTMDRDIRFDYCDVPYCPGSSELRSVNCSFDTPYMCGYEIENTEGGVEWERRGTHVRKHSALFYNTMKSEYDVCYFTKTGGADYRGAVSQSRNGIPCQRWAASFPHHAGHNDADEFPDATVEEASNFCRNPSGIEDNPWCYTIIPTARGGGKQSCAIPQCIDGLMIARSTGHSHNSSTMYSPYFTLHSTVTYCLQFKLLMTGYHVGGLQISLQDRTNLSYTIYDFYGHQSDSFKTFQKPLHNIQGVYRLAITAHPGYTTNPIVLDGINLAPRDCLFQAVKACSPIEYKCMSGQCIDKSEVCDGINHCSDFSDEADCECREDEFSCGYKQRCISQSLVLDGNEDCPNGMDERIQSKAHSRRSLGAGGVTSRGAARWGSRHPMYAPNITYLNDAYDYLHYFDFAGDKFLQLTKNSAHKQADLIHRCRYKNTECRKSDLTAKLVDYGTCYTFNADPENVLLTNTTGSHNGLSLVLNIESYEYMSGPNQEAGVKVYMHPPGEVELVRDLGFALAPGMHFLVDIDHTQRT